MGTAACEDTKRMQGAGRPDLLRTGVQHCADIDMMSRCLDTEQDTLDPEACLLSVSYQARPRPGPCPSEGRVASCETGHGRLHYYGGGGQQYSQARAKEQCKGIHAGRVVDPGAPPARERP